jgi:predicted transcriptional regulator YdeE
MEGTEFVVAAKAGEVMREPQFVERDRVLLAGLGFFGDPFGPSGGWTEENEIGRLWSRFMAHMRERGGELRGVHAPHVGYEVHIEHAETASTGHVEVFVGVEVVSVEGVPVELAVKVLPPATYAVFTLRGEEIVSDWPRAIYNEWMPEAGYEPAAPFMFELYDERFAGMDDLEGSEIDVYVPVRPVE